MRHGPSFHSGPLNWLLLKGAEPPPAARRKASGFSRHSILGLPIGSLRGDHIPSHEQSLFGVTPLDLLGEGWSVNQLNLIFLGWRDPGAATESKPESRAKPGGGKVLLSNRLRATTLGAGLWLLPPSGAHLQEEVVASLLKAQGLWRDMFFNGFGFWKQLEVIWS